MTNRLLVLGLCTYKRPALLLSCLESIAQTEKPAGIPLFLLIADNDPAGSARDIVSAFAVSSGMKIDYAVETGRGIPFARNNVMRRALESGATELIFIDDDERVSFSWLVNLWNYYTNSGADVVRGFVKTEYAADTPKWIVKGNYYQRKNHATGTVFQSASTNNVLFNFTKIVKEGNFWFDESFGMRGGSDSDFFSRAAKAGAVILWANDAVVAETLESERYSLSYFLKRKFRTRNGITFFKELSLSGRLTAFLRAVWKIATGLLFLPVSVFMGSHRIVKALSRVVEGTGRLFGLLGIHIGWDEYHGK